MSPAIVRVEGLWKKFGLTIKDCLRYGLIDSGRRLLGSEKDSERLRQGEFWALQDVNFELQRGEALGILGLNGSGKTTLLRILNGAFSPDRGRVEFRGRIGALIAAGAGFSPLLTGRENIFVSGSLLGLSQAELNKKFDEIVAFSGLEQFIDMPVRNYSSGMAVRLGFAVAVLGQPDVLLVDEVLAVGDAGFQKKCYERILEIIQNGTTVIFVSHSIGAVWAICTKGLFLEKGVPSGVISVEDACRKYDIANYRVARAAVQEKHTIVSQESRTILDAEILTLEICDTQANAKTEFRRRENIQLKTVFKITKTIDDLIVRYSIDAVHYKFIAMSDSTYSDGMGIVKLDPGIYCVVTELRKPRFRPGTYSVNVAICRKAVAVHLCFEAGAGAFTVLPFDDRFMYDSEGPAVLDLDASYSLRPGEGRHA
jgi:lipopolysaccharide transport system ATP-binding protein